MVGIIDSLFSFQIFGIPIIPIVVVIALIFYGSKYLKFTSRQKELKSPNINVEKLTKKELDKITKTHGFKKFTWKNLRIGINPRGKILRYMYEDHEFTDILSKERVTIPLYLIRTSRLPMFLAIFGLGIERYFIRGDLLENFSDGKLSDQSDLIVNPSSKFRRYNNIWYCDSYSRSVIHDLAIGFAFEQQTKKFVEFTPLMTLLEIEQAKVKFKSELFTKLEKERFRGDVEKYSKEKSA